MNRWLLITAACVASAGMAAGAVLADPKHATFQADNVAWQPGPASMEAGAEFTVLYGDPSDEGPFTMWIRLPADFTIMPHVHPSTENVTVISGTFHMSPGETLDRDNAMTKPAGSHTWFEAGSPHAAWTSEPTIIQLHGIGPWDIEYVDPEDDPRHR